MTKDVHSLLKRINQTGIAYQVFERAEASPVAVESDTASTQSPPEAIAEDQGIDPEIEAIAAATEAPQRSRPELIYERPPLVAATAPRTLFRRYAKPGASGSGADTPDVKPGERLSELFRRYAD